MIFNKNIAISLTKLIKMQVIRLMIGYLNMLTINMKSQEFLEGFIMKNTTLFQAKTNSILIISNVQLLVDNIKILHFIRRYYQRSVV